MARPIKYDEKSRAHLGLRFNKHVLELFDTVVRKYGINRLQAVEFLVINAIMEDHIPPRHHGIDAKIEELKTKDESNVVRNTSPERKGKLVAGKPESAKLLGSRREHLVNK